MAFFKRAYPVVKEKVFVTVPLMNRVISMEMEKRLPELSFQMKNRASGRVSYTETWNCSQIINVTVMIVMMLVIMIIHLTILTPTLFYQRLQQSQMRDSTATKSGVHCSAMKQRVFEIFGLNGLLKFLNKMR